MSEPTALEAAREVAQQKLDSALDSMPPRSRAHTEIDVQVPIDALRALIAATTPPADDVRDRLVIRHVGGNTLGGTVEQVLSTHLAKGWSVESFEVRPRGTVTDALYCAHCQNDDHANSACEARGTATDGEVRWEYGIRASGDDEPYSDVSDDVDWLIDHFTFGVPGEQIVRRRKAGPWEVRT